MILKLQMEVVKELNNSVDKERTWKALVLKWHPDKTTHSLSPQMFRMLK